MSLLEPARCHMRSDWEGFDLSGTAIRYKFPHIDEPMLVDMRSVTGSK